MRGDGDGWAYDPEGVRRWGKHGAAGLLLRAPLPTGEPVVLLQHRALWSHQGGTWALPGGARDSHELPAEAAVREAYEEAGIDPALVRVRAETVTAGGARHWVYTTVVADAAGPLPTTANHESVELRWVPEGAVPELELHPGFAQCWPNLAVKPVRLVVDTANLLGARPNGWWRDRAGATAALLHELVGVLPRTVPLPGCFGWLSSVDAVLEGEARAAAERIDLPALRLHLAPGSGDDHVLRVAGAAQGWSAAAPPEPVDPAVTVVVTADKGLRARLPASIAVLRPRQVLAWLDERVADN